jgi:outer membrane protein TolC
MSRRLVASLGSASVALATVFFGACASRGVDSTSVPPRPDRPWEPPAAVAAAVQAPPAPPAAILPSATASLPAALATLPNGRLGLPLAIDIALANSPRTRTTWQAARAAAEEVGSQRSQLYPDIDLLGTEQRQKGTVGGGQITFQQTTFVPAVNLSWLLLDFGGRAADVEEAREALYAADFAHNQQIQDVVLDVTTAYYGYVSVRALAEAAQSDLDAARRNLEAADRRHDAGLATIADVLQAKTEVSAAQLQLQTAEGRGNVIRGNLATAMGLPADLPVDAEPLDDNVPVVAASESIESTLGVSLEQRPELQAARARALAATARIRQERSDALPTVSLGANDNRIYYNIPGRDPGTNYAAFLQVRVPLFSGFEHRHDVERARAEAEEENARVASLADDVRLEVWTSYYDLQTAAQQYATTLDLLAAADESARVAAGRYQEGVGNILDLLSAQRTLANARAQKILSRASWLSSVARLAHSTGTLLGNPTLAPPPAASTPQ